MKNLHVRNTSCGEIVFPLPPWFAHDDSNFNQAKSFAEKRLPMAKPDQLATRTLVSRWSESCIGGKRLPKSKPSTILTSARVIAWAGFTGLEQTEIMQDYLAVTALI